MIIPHLFFLSVLCRKCSSQIPVCHFRNPSNIDWNGGFTLLREAGNDRRGMNEAPRRMEKGGDQIGTLLEAP